MRKVIGVLAVIVLAVAALALSFRGAPLAVGEIPELTPPVAAPPEDMTIAVLPTGTMASVAAMAYQGGGFRDERVFGMDPVLIRHPKGDLLIDAGFGSDVDAHFETTPMLMQLTASYSAGTPVAEQLRAAGREPSSLHGILLTHAHWDHVSGLADLPGVPVWVSAAERDFVASDEPAAGLAHRLADDVTWRIYDFPDGPYLGFERSYDVHDDGSVVVVPAGGHTPGSVVVFVTLPDGARYAFIGDLVWQREALALPAERPWVSRRMVDVDDQRVRDLVVRLHRIKQALPGMIFVPAHDRRVTARLPPFAAGPE